MKEILENIFAVEVDDNANTFEYKHKWNALGWYAGEQAFKNIRGINVFDGPYEILFTTKDCTDEQARELRLADADEGFGYKDYEEKSSGTFYARISLHSLLRSHGLDTNKNYLLVRKTS